MIKDLTSDFKYGKILPLVFKLVIPAVIAQLITFFYNLVDRMYVSSIEGIATEALAALGIVLPITIIVQAFANLIGLGASPKASMALGENDYKKANKIFNNSFVLLVIIGIIMTIFLYIFSKDIVILFGAPENSIVYAASYLRIYSLGSVFIILVQGLNPFISAQGHSIVAMGTTLLGALVNIILDPIFIFNLSLNVDGAAIATVISQFLSFVWIVFFFLNKGSTFKYKFKDMVLNFKIIGAFLFLGLSPFIMTFTESLIQIVFNICLKSTTGGESSAYTAALTIMLSALQLISLPLNGLGYGIAPFVSFNYGSGDSKRLKKGISYTFIIALVFCVIIYTLSMIFPQIYGYIFNAENDVMDLIKSYLPLFIMGTIMFPVQMTLQNINVALGQGKSAVILATMRKVVILIPLCFLLAHFVGYNGVYMSEGIADLTAGFITSIVIFTSFPRVIKKRSDEVLKKKECLINKENE